MAPVDWIILVSAGIVLTGCLLRQRQRFRAWNGAMEELRSSEERYRVLFDQSPRPMYAFDLETLVFLNVNESALRHYGYSRQEFLSLTADKIRPPEEVPLMLQRTSRGTQTACMTRHRKRDGTIIDVEVSVQHLINRGRTVVLVAVNDVTDQKRAEESLKSGHEDLARSVSELKKREADLRQLAAAGEILQACHTSEEAYSMVSELLPQIFPHYSGCLYVLKPSRNVVEGVAWWGRVSQNVFRPDDCWALRTGRIHLIEDGRGPRCKHSPTLPTTLCIPMMAQSDAIGVLHLVQDTLRDGEAGSPIPHTLQSIARTAADQIALALSNIRFREALQHQSIRDPLTTLFNRRYMEESLERELHRANRDRDSVAVVMIDVDHFKQFNDSYGHRNGDKMLCLLSRYLQSSVRLEDIACRYGGEEFVLILPSTDLDNSIVRTSELLEGARKLRLETDGLLTTLTVSAGIAVYPTHGADSELLLAAADHALYDAKRAGRDRFSMASTLDPLVRT